MRRRDSLVVVARWRCSVVRWRSESRTAKEGQGRQQRQRAELRSRRSSTPVRFPFASAAEKGKRVVRGRRPSSGTPLTGPQKFKPGKTLNVTLSSAGKAAMGGCSITGLQGRLVKGKKKKGKKSAGSAVTPLVRDLAACQDLRNRAEAAIPLDPRVCLQPGRTTTSPGADPTTGTGRRLDLQADADAREHGGSNRPDGHQPRRRVQPRQPDHREDPQVATQQAFDNSGLVPIDIRAPYGCEPAGGGDRPTLASASRSSRS